MPSKRKQIPTPLVILLVIGIIWSGKGIISPGTKSEVGWSGYEWEYDAHDREWKLANNLRTLLTPKSRLPYVVVLLICIGTIAYLAKECA